MEPIVIKTWIIMDKNRKVLGMGNPRDRRLQFVNQQKGSGRMLTYKSKKIAENGFKASGFYTWGEVSEYLLKEYSYGKRWQREDGVWDYSHVRFEDFLEAVEIEITVKAIC